MKPTRRDFLKGVSAGAAVWTLAQPRSFAAPSWRLSACDWSLGCGSNPEALEVGKAIGLQGVEISAGSPDKDDLDVADPAFRQRYKDLVAKTGVVVSSVAMGLLNNAPFATDPRGPKWLEQTIAATQDLGAKVILMAFFGKGDLRDKDGLKTKDVDAVVERVKAAAPLAEKAGVVLGLENTLSAKDNMAILDRIQSKAVAVYYDVGNSTNNGYDVPAEIVALGNRICQFHFKDGGDYLGEGKVMLDPIVEAIRKIGYSGWLVLETSSKNKDRDESFKKNAATLRKVFGMA